MLSQLGPSHIIFIMQLTTYLISILVLVLEGAGYHCHPAQSFKFFSVINSTVVSIFLYPTKPLSSFTFKFPLLSLSYNSSSSSSQLGSNPPHHPLHMSHPHLPIPHLHLHRTTDLQLSISHVHLHTPKSL